MQSVDRHISHGQRSVRSVDLSRTQTGSTMLYVESDPATCRIKRWIRALNVQRRRNHGLHKLDRRCSFCIHRISRQCVVTRSTRTTFQISESRPQTLNSTPRYAENHQVVLPA